MSRRLLMYTRTAGCPFVTTAKRVLAEYNVPYTEIFTDQDALARQRLLDWVGFLSVPTLVIAEEGQLTPYEEPAYLERGHTPRGINRGSMITEPNIDQLTEWLKQHHLID